MKRYMTVARYGKQPDRSGRLYPNPTYYTYDRKHREYMEGALSDREVALKRTADLNGHYGPL